LRCAGASADFHSELASELLMATGFESVKSRALPKDLALRVAVGRAAQTLEVFSVTGQLTDHMASVLRAAARLLRPAEDMPLRSGRSIGESAETMDLIMAARDAFQPPDMESLVARLSSLATELERIADERTAAPNRLTELIQVLDALSDVIAASRASTSERSVSRQL
jgi:hypothetical protein